MYEYKTLLVMGNVSNHANSINYLNTLYENGWEFVNAIPENISTGGNSHLAGGIYFTVRRLKTK